LDGNAHDVGVSDLQFPHDSVLLMVGRCQYNSFMRHYLRRHV
jgi:hypothetical protein